MILVTLCSLLCMSVFHVWSLSLDCILLITAITLVPLITLSVNSLKTVKYRKKTFNCWKDPYDKTIKSVRGSKLSDDPLLKLMPLKSEKLCFKQFSAYVLKTIIDKKKLWIDEMILMINPTKILFESKLSDNSLLELLPLKTFKQVSNSGFWERLFLCFCSGQQWKVSFHEPILRKL